MTRVKAHKKHAAETAPLPPVADVDAVLERLRSKAPRDAAWRERIGPLLVNPPREVVSQPDYDAASAGPWVSDLAGNLLAVLFGQWSRTRPLAHVFNLASPLAGAAPMAMSRSWSVADADRPAGAGADVQFAAALTPDDAYLSRDAYARLFRDYNGLEHTIAHRNRLVDSTTALGDRGVSSAAGRALDAWSLQLLGRTHPLAFVLPAAAAVPSAMQYALDDTAELGESLSHGAEHLSAPATLVALARLTRASLPTAALGASAAGGVAQLIHGALSRDRVHHEVAFGRYEPETHVGRAVLQTLAGDVLGAAATLSDDVHVSRLAHADQQRYVRVAVRQHLYDTSDKLQNAVPGFINLDMVRAKVGVVTQHTKLLHPRDVYQLITRIIEVGANGGSVPSELVRGLSQATSGVSPTTYRRELEKLMNERKTPDRMPAYPTAAERAQAFVRAANIEHNNLAFRQKLQQWSSQTAQQLAQHLQLIHSYLNLNTTALASDLQPMIERFGVEATASMFTYPDETAWRMAAQILLRYTDSKQPFSTAFLSPSARAIVDRSYASSSQKLQDLLTALINEASQISNAQPSPAEPSSTSQPTAQ